MSDESKVQYLIVDTSAFIKNAPLKDITNKIVTEPNVLDEIKSKRQLKRLVVFPCQVEDIEVREAFPEDIAFVTEFSKKTGDYPSLSATDIKVIALTLRYEREKVGTQHLKTEPEIRKKVVDSNVHQPDDNTTSFAGFYMPKGNENDKESTQTEEANENRNEESNEEYENNNCKNKGQHRMASECSNSSVDNSQNLKTSNDENDENKSESDYESIISNDEKKDVDELNRKFETLHCDLSELEVDCGDDLTIDDILKPVKNDSDKLNEGIHNEQDQENKNESEEEEEEDDDDDDDDNDDDGDGWITPSNIKNVRIKMDSGVVKEKPATVACLTMDYAMQNVMMHMGLNLCSLEGKVIKQMRTFILRCYACFKTTGVITKQFCPHCGHKTLKKVAVSLDDEGNQIIHINYKKPLTSKGKKFSLPTFKGGKHACNPILFDDQPLPDQRPTKLGRARNDPLNEDYIAGYSPFAIRDVNSRAAMLGIKSDTPTKYWMKRNPNEARRHRK